METENPYNSDIETIREKEFPFLKDTTYVDHAGAALYCKSQVEAQQHDLLSNLYGNPHSNNQSSRLATDAVDQIRYRILKFFNTNQDEYSVIFTSGCTGALKLVAESFTFDPSLHGDGSIKSTNATSDTTRRTGCFCYLLDNHTSVQGMREIVAERAGVILCIDPDNVEGQGHECLEPVFTAKEHIPGGNNLFAYPAQSNFSGCKYPLAWTGMIECRQMGFQQRFAGQWYTLLDAAAFVSTSRLDLQSHCPEFVALSFYKMFGLPTGLGALLVKNSATHLLRKTYFGGGTVAASSAEERFHVFRESVSERFEDGTIPFLEILSLRHGFDALENLAGGIVRISEHTFTVSRFFHHNLVNMLHGNGQPLSEVYCHGNFDDITLQGPIVCFNLLRADGSYIGFAEVDKMAQLHEVHLRTGCFCNIGACQKNLRLSSQQIKENFQAGHVCGDNRDLINGQPTGAVRISFGYMSTIKDAQTCLHFISQCFLEGVKLRKDYRTVTLTEFNKSFPVNTHSHKSFHTQNSQHFVDSSVVKATLCSESKGQGSCSNNRLPPIKNSQLSINKILGPCENIPGPIVQSESKLQSNQSGNILHSKDNFPVNQSDTPSYKHVSQSNPLSQTELEMSHILGTCSEDNRRLTGIYLYPVKSCGAFQVDEWPIHSRGLLYDRDWMVVSESGVVLSQKRETNLCLITPRIDLQQQTLQLSFPEMPNLVIPLNSNEEYSSMEAQMCTSKVCGDRVNGIDCGDEAGEWLSQALQRPGLRLVQQNKDDIRHSKLKDSMNAESSDVSSLSLVNESQYLLITRQSVEDLRRRIRQRQEEGFTPDTALSCVPDIENLIGRFRGNLIIGGGVPFEEDEWSSIEIGSTQFVSQGGCTRCQMVCVDQSSGKRSMEPLRTLAAWRGRKVPFGIHMRHLASTGSTLKVGDQVRVVTKPL